MNPTQVTTLDQLSLIQMTSVSEVPFQQLQNQPEFYPHTFYISTDYYSGDFQKNRISFKLVPDKKNPIPVNLSSVESH